MTWRPPTEPNLVDLARRYWVAILIAIITGVVVAVKVGMQ